MGVAFLRLFAETCNAATDTPCFPALSYDTVQVLREHANIDILIQDRHHAIVIENKIYAGDQHEQIKRYHDIVVGSFRTPSLFYLTLDGTPPSDWSLGGLEAEITCLAYSNEIDSWLNACIKEAATRPTLRETIVQYQQLIHNLTGKNMNEEEKKQVLELISKDNNAEQAAIIARNWKHIRWHSEWDFWNELLALVQKSYVVSDVEMFSDENLSTVIHGSRNKNYYYGILFQVGKVLENDLHLKIERGEEPVYYGFHNLSEIEPVNSRLREILKPITDNSNDSWAGWKYTNAGIDFYNFDSSSITLHLANAGRRQEIVGALWIEIQEFIEKAQLALQQEFGTDFTPILPKA